MSGVRPALECAQGRSNSPAKPELTNDCQGVTVPRDRVLSYRDLIVWQRAMDLTDYAYDLTKSFPRDERLALTSQVQRAAVSIPSDIAEGHGRRHLGEYLQYLSIANGSLMELETQFVIASRRQYIDQAALEHGLNLSGDVGRLLAGLVRALKARRP